MTNVTIGGYSYEPQRWNAKMELRLVDMMRAAYLAGYPEAKELSEKKLHAAIQAWGERNWQTALNGSIGSLDNAFESFLYDLVFRPAPGAPQMSVLLDSMSGLSQDEMKAAVEGLLFFCKSVADSSTALPSSRDGSSAGARRSGARGRGTAAGSTTRTTMTARARRK